MTRPPTPGRRARALLMLLVLALVPAVGLAPGSSAQGGTADDAGWPRTDDRLVPLLDHEEELLADASGDTELFGLGGETPENDMEAAADILTLGLGEDAGRFLVSLGHRGYDDVAYDVKDPLFGQYVCTITFSVAADRAHEYTTVIESFGFNNGGLYGSLWRSEAPDENETRSGYYGRGDHVASFDVQVVADDHMELVLDKEWIRVGARDRLLTTEDVLQDFAVECQYTASIFAGWSDGVDRGSAQSGSGSYQIRSAAGSDRIGIDVAEDLRERQVFTAAPGQSQKIPLVIGNKMDRKAIVNLTVALTDLGGDTLDDWKAVLTPTVEVKANTSTTATLIVTPSTDADHRETARLQITGRLLGFDDAVRLDRTVSANVPPSVERPTLHFHDAGRAGSFCLFGVCDPDQADIGGGRLFALNVLDDDPLYDDGATEPSLVRFAGGDAHAELDLPLARPLRLDAEGTVDLVLGLSAQVEHDVRARIQLYTADGELFLGGTQRVITVGSSADEHTFRIIPREEALEIPAGTRLAMRIGFSLAVGAGTISGAGPGLSWHPDDSSLTFPLLPLPDPDVSITDGRAMPTIAMRNGSEAEEYINPGKSRLWELALVNEGVETDILEVTIDTDHDDWSVQVQPGTRFRLEPGQAAPFSIQVTAPDDAEELEELTLNLTARSANDADVRSTITLRALVTTGVQYDNETYAPSADEEQVAPYIEKSEESPGLSLVALLLGFVGLMVVGRRRRPE